MSSIICQNTIELCRSFSLSEIKSVGVDDCKIQGSLLFHISIEPCDVAFVFVVCHVFVMNSSPVRTDQRPTWCSGHQEVNL